MSIEEGAFNRQLVRVTASAFEDRVEQLAAAIERLAGKVRAESARSYIDRASYIQHTVLWAVANLNLDNLPRYALQADQAEEKAAQEPTSCVCCSPGDCGDRRGHVRDDRNGEHQCNCGRDWPCEKAGA